jgi:hypothetical protein
VVPGASVSHRVRHVRDEAGVSIEIHLAETRSKGLQGEVREVGGKLALNDVLQLTELARRVEADDSAVIRRYQWNSLLESEFPQSVLSRSQGA